MVIFRGGCAVGFLLLLIGCYLFEVIRHASAGRPMAGGEHAAFWIFIGIMLIPTAINKLRDL